MRIFGTILVLLALACLVIGVVTLLITASSGARLVIEFQDIRNTVEANIDNARDVIQEVEMVFDDSKAAVRDYENGKIKSIDDERIEETFDNVRGLLVKTEEVRSEAGESLEKIEKFKERIEGELGQLAVVAAVSVIALVVSGWLMAFGFWAVSAARRREYEA